MCEVKTQWTLMWWLLGTMCMPLTVPYLVLQLIGMVRERQNRECLSGKVVVITGASSGLGESLAHTFYVAGCKVVLASRRKEELERVRKDLMELHSPTTTYPPVIVPLDLSDLNSLPAKVDEILSVFGHIDILINNGGISVRADVLSTTMDVDIKVMLVNYFGTVAMTKAVLPSMIKRREGRIVCIGSVQGKFAIPYRSSYAASKHALQAFCDSLRSEIQTHNVKVTLISPGYISTDLSKNALVGSGDAYGVTDAATATGENPDSMAKKILRETMRDSKDSILSSLAPKAAYYIRFLCPPLYFWIMAKRADKLAVKDKNI